MPNEVVYLSVLEVRRRRRLGGSHESKNEQSIDSVVYVLSFPFESNTFEALISAPCIANYLSTEYVI